MRRWKEQECSRLSQKAGSGTAHCCCPGWKTWLWLADWLACSNAGGSSPIWSCYFAVFRVANRARVDALAT